MLELVMVRVGAFARPVDPLSERLFAGITNRSEFRAAIDAPRNLKQLKAVHALLKIVADNHPDFRSVEEIKRELKRRSGMYREFILRGDLVAYELESISPATMDQTRFAEVWERWKHIIATDMVPGLRSEAIQDEVLRQL